MDFKQVPKKYRPVPFWSWNEKLDIEETKRQVREMEQAGIGGFFMHARGGLQTEYMGEEWFENVTAAMQEAESLEMYPWAYDENGWPSGFGDGAVNALGVEYQQKYLRMEETLEHTETAICKCGEYYFYYDINPYYVDTLDKKVIAEFIKKSYVPYIERYGQDISGFFTDEPQISTRGIPWSFVLEEEYQKRYGENLLECLDQLFFAKGDYKQTRVNFWKMITDLFSEAYMKQIYDFCDANGVKLTGHLVSENNILSQLTTNGACMPHYEYFHIPGMDWLRREINSHIVPLQVSSVAEQLGKEAVLSETFAGCGHSISFAELKGLYEWQMVRGINSLCQHLEGYSLRGIRKRDWPPAMYLQQPWWAEYRRFNDAMSRESMILREGTHHVETLLLHPQTTAWTLYDWGENEGMSQLSRSFREALRVLEEKHVEFHLGDETMMERHGKVENGKLIIGKQSYSVIVDPGCEVLLPHTKALLEAFVSQGGQIVKAEEVKENPVIDNPYITYTKRALEQGTVHFFVNTSSERASGNVLVKGRKLDIYTGELLEHVNGMYEFEPWGSLMVIEEAADASDEKQNVELPAKTYIRPTGTFCITDASFNSITLDTCDYYFDGELQETNGYVLNICERANALGRSVQLHQDYHVKVSYIPKELYLVCETPWNFRISINGVEIVQQLDGTFVDQSFCKLDIAQYMCLGENTISFDCELKQSEQFYENLKKARVFESEKNKLVYDMEIEAVYLVGNFGVQTDGTWTALEKRAVRYHGDFVLEAPKKKITPQHIEQQGYPFFCGYMTLEGELDITGENPVLDIDWQGINALRVKINGIEKVMMTDNQLSLAEFGVSGPTKVTFTLFNNLRNLLGPHHSPDGELHHVNPSMFFKEGCIWNHYQDAAWDEDYCLIEMGL